MPIRTCGGVLQGDVDDKQQQLVYHKVSEFFARTLDFDRHLIKLLASCMPALITMSRLLNA
jgi:hypothetical protein